MGKILLRECHQQGMLFQDLVCMLSELNLGPLYDNVREIQDDCSSVCYINYFIYSSLYRMNTQQQQILRY